MKCGNRIKLCSEMLGFNKCAMLIVEEVFKVRTGKSCDLGSMVLWMTVE